MLLGEVDQIFTKNRVAELLLTIVRYLDERRRVSAHGLFEHFCDCLLNFWVRVIKVNKDVLHTVVV